MVKSLRNIVGLLLITSVLLSACSLSSSSDKTPSTGSSNGQPTVPAVVSGTPGAISGTPIKASPIILAPPVLVAKAASGTQNGNYGSYYWMITSGLADKASARGIEIQKDPLEVKHGETLEFNWTQQNSQSDSTLKDLTISIYPEEKSIVTVTTAQGTLTGFKASGTPAQTDKLSTASPSWAANLGAGKYFVQVVGNWSNPIVPDKPRNCEYGFFIEIK